MNEFLNTFFNWEQMWGALPQLFTVGLPNTVMLTVASFVFATVIGLILTLAMVSPFGVLRVLAKIWIDVWRGLPAILTILLIGAGLPLAGFNIFGRDTYSYAILALAIINGAFLAEIFRSGIQSVESGQSEAARSLGVSRGRTMWMVILPQGLRRVIPAAMNQFIILLKETALVYVLGLTAGRRELFSIGYDAAAFNGNYSVMVAAAFFFLVITIPLTHAVNAWDKRLRDGSRKRKNGSQTTGPVPLPSDGAADRSPVHSLSSRSK